MGVPVCEARPLDGRASPVCEMERWGGGAERVALVGTERVWAAMTVAAWRVEGVPVGVAVPFVSFGGFVDGRGAI